jgi:membrane-bound ClpP family serine protease
MILQPPGPDEIDPMTDYDRMLRSLVGQVGRTLTPHLPSGVTEFGGRRWDTVSIGTALDAGTLVQVVDVQGRRLLVRKLEAEAPGDATA